MKKLIIFFSLFFFTSAPMAFANIVNPHEIYTYEKMKADIWELNKTYEKQLAVKTIGYSHFGRKILAVKLGKGKKNILLMGAHHGREWLTSSLLMEMLETYAKAYQTKENIGPFSTALLDEVSIWFIPMINPDGVTIQQGGWRLFPKYYQDNILALNENSYDFSRWKANGMGVDLNRQYPAGWDTLNQEEVNGPSYQFYKGKRPLATHESKAIVKFTKTVKPLLAASYHTSGREIYWEYKNGKNRKRDLAIAQKVADLTGYDLAAPPKESIGGGYTDWFINTFKRPALTIEISPLVKETNPSIAVFSDEWERNELIGMMLVKEAKDKVKLK
jgi:g-D-glutamyl-meso-diaminopimelate peptidase